MRGLPPLGYEARDRGLVIVVRRLGRSMPKLDNCQLVIAKLLYKACRYSDILTRTRHFSGMRRFSQVKRSKLYEIV
jgi:hypothetical protein